MPRISTVLLYVGAVVLGYWIAWQIECLFSNVANVPMP